MSLHAIVAALGGDLYNGGWRASIPAPGHSADDRSVSLLLSEGRVVIHGFGEADWRTARDDLRARGFIDDAGRLTGGGRGGVSTPRPDLRVRRETAARLWAGVVPLQSIDPAGRHLTRRAIRSGGSVLNLGFHPQAPVCVYRDGGRSRPARLRDHMLRAVQGTGNSVLVDAYLQVSSHLSQLAIAERRLFGDLEAEAAAIVAMFEAPPGGGLVQALSDYHQRRIEASALLVVEAEAGRVAPPGS